MFEGLIQKVLLAIFGRFIDGLDKKQINLSFLKGNLVIENVSIKKEALEALQLPIELVYSSIQRIEINLPWNKLTTQRTEIKIHSVFLLVTTVSEDMWGLEEINYYKPKAAQVRAYIKKVMDEEIRKQETTTDNQERDQKEAGFFQKQITRIVDNLYISISDVHFRYEHCISKHSFSWGITINHITQQTVDSEWKISQTSQPYIHERKDSTFVNKQIQLSKLAMYWNSDDHYLILSSIIKPQHDKNIDVQKAIVKMDPYKIDLDLRQRTVYQIDEKMQARIQSRLQQELVYEPDNLTMGIKTSKSSKYIFCLNAVANVVQTYQNFRKVPEYKIKVELQEMDFKIKHTQYKEILKLVSIFNLYQYSAKQQMDQYLTTVLRPQPQDFLKMETNSLYLRSLFQYLVKAQIMEIRRKRFLEFEMNALQRKTTPSALLKSQHRELRQYQQIVIKTSITTLQMWAKQALEIYERAKEHHQIEQAFKKEIEKAYKPSAFMDEETYVYLEFRLSIVKGSLKLLRKHKNLEEGFTLLWKNFDFFLQKRRNNFEVEQIIQDMEVQMFSVEEKNDIIVPIVKKIKSYDIQEKPLIYFKLEKHPLSRPNYFTSIYLDVQKIEFMVFVASLQRVIAYFRMPPQDDKQQEGKVKENIRKNKKEQKNKNDDPDSEKKIETQTKNYISITIQSPIVIIPNQQINDLHSDCWVLKLGDLEIITVDDRQVPGFIKLGSDNYRRLGVSGESVGKSRIVEQPLLTVHNEKNQLVSQFNFANVNSINPLEKSASLQHLQQPQQQNHQQQQHQRKHHKSQNYDNYVMKLKSVQLQYFSSIHYFYNYQKLSQTQRGMEILNNPLRMRSKKYDVLEDFSMELNLYFKKSSQANLPQTKINFELPSLTASINPEVPYTFQKLMQTINDLSADQSLSSILQQEKSKLIKYSSCKGILRKRGKFLRSWSSYFAVLSGWYIYLYQNESDVDYNQYVGLRDVVVSEAQQDIGVQNSFKIKSKKEIIYFQAKTAQEKNRWFKFIQQKIHDIKTKTNNLKIGSENTVPQQNDKGRREFEQTTKQMPKLNDELLTKYRFQIKRFQIELKYNQQSEILITFDQIKLLSLSGINDNYQEFTINSISIEDHGQSILRSIHYSQPNTPNILKVRPSITENKLLRKIKQVTDFQEEDAQQIHGAIRVRMCNTDSHQPSQPQSYIVAQLSSLEAHYLESFLAKINLFLVRPSLQKSKESTTDLSEFTDTTQQTTTMKYTQIPVSETKFMQTRYDQTKVNIKSVRSFTLQKSSVSDSDMHEGQQVESNEKLPESIIKVSILTQDIKLIVIVLEKEREKEKPNEFLQIQVNQISAVLTINDDEYFIEGHIQKIEIIDLKSLQGTRHMFLGKKEQKDKKKTKEEKTKKNIGIPGLTIFSNKQQIEKQMVQFKYSKFKIPINNDDISDDLYLIVRDCFIDYLHATIIKVLSLLEIAQKKKQANKEENEQDLELIKQKLNAPSFFKIKVLLENPKILIKPAGNINQSFELQIKSVCFELDASKEKNKIIEMSVRANKKQSQIVPQLDSLWWQIIVVSADTMRILIRSTTDLQYISNPFSGVLRIQTPMFVSEYETLFPNIVLNRNQEIRIKVTDIQLNILRNHYLFLLQVMQTQYEIQSLKTQKKRKQQQQVKKQQNQAALIFKLSKITIRLMDECNQYASQGQFFRPLLDLSLLDIVFQFKTNLSLQVQDLKSTYYQYPQQDDNNLIVRIQHVINNIVLERRKLEEFLDEDILENKVKEVKELINEMKMEFYNEQPVSRFDIDDKLSVKAILGEDTTDVSINIGESKYLINAYYLKTIALFFEIPKYEDDLKSQQSPSSSQPIQTQYKQKQPLLNVNIILLKTLIITHNESLKNCLVLQLDSFIKLNDELNNQAHSNYHQKNNEQYSNQSNIKNRKLELSLTMSLFNTNFAAIQKISKQTKKKMILYPIKIEFIRNQFTCECDMNYSNYKTDGQNELISNIIIQDLLRFDKIRINTSHNDYALILQTIKFQQEQIKLCDQFFSDDQESSVNETIIRQLPIKPSLVTEQTILSRNDTKRKSFLPGKSQLSRLKSSILQGSQQKDEVMQVFYAAADQDMEIVKEEEILSEQEFQFETIKPSVKINKMKIKLDLLEIVLVNDINKSFAPLLLFRFNVEKFMFDQNHISKALTCQFQIELLYFNPVVSKMEPIIEPYSSELLIVQQNQYMQTIHINGQTQNLQILDLNLSTDMILNLYKTLTQWQQLDQDDEEDTFRRNESKKITRLASMKGISFKENQDNVTLFSLHNKSGYTLKVQKNGSEGLIEIANNDSKNYEVQSHDEDYAKTFESDTRLMIKFLDASMVQNSISNVPINYAGVKKLQWNDQSQYYVLSTQIENLQKTITIYSPYMFVNQTDCDLSIKLSCIKITKNFILKPGEQAAMPQELYKDDSFIVIHFSDSKYNKLTQPNEPIFIKRIFHDITIQIQHYPCYTLATLNTNLVQNVKYIEFKPAFILYNLLPVPLQFLFHSNENLEIQKLIINHYKKPNTITQYEKQQSALSRGNSLNHLQNDQHDNLVRSITVTEFNYTATIKIEAGLIEVVPQGELQLHWLKNGDHLGINLHVHGFELSQQQDIMQATQFELRDTIASQSCHIKVEKEQVKQTKLIYFSVQTCIINTTNQRLKYYTLKDQKPLILSGQNKEPKPDKECFESNYDKIQITDTIKYLMIGVDDCISNEVNVGILGSLGLQLKQKHGGMVSLNEFGIHISLANNVIRKGVYTKVIEIMPRFVILNNTGVQINICQSGYESQPKRLNPNERYHLIWPDCRLEKSIRIQKHGKYNWSGDLFINEIRSTNFFSSGTNENSQQLSNISIEQQKSRIFEKSGIYKQFNLKKYDPQEFLHYKESLPLQTSMLCQSSQDFFKDCLFLTAEITKVKATNFILLEQQNEENQLYKLVNKCRPFKIHYGQDSYNSFQEWVLDCDQTVPFSWEQPSHSFKLRVKFVYNQKVEHVEIIDFQQQESLQEIKFSNYFIWIKSEFQGQTRVITFQQVNETMRNMTNSHKREIEDIHKLIKLYISQLGISIITKRQNILLEANYIYMSGIELGIMQTENETTAQLRVKFFHIDNNTSLDTTTPVLMTLRRYYQVTHDRNYYFLEASCSFEHQVKAILLYNSIKIYIQPFQLQFDEEYIQVVLETIKQVKQCLQNQFELEYNGSPHSIKSLCFQTPQQRHYYLESMFQQNSSNPCIVWKSLEIKRSKKQVYIKEFVLSKIDLRFSFHKRFRTNIQYDENVFNLFSTAIGATVQNFNEAEIILDCFRLRSVYDSKEIVLQSIQDHYKSEIIRSILKIIGSIEIIGNPVKFVQQITNGVVDFVEMPIQGLRHGPLEFGVGLCKGTGSLLKNTVAGAFYSVNKVTGSISASVSLLTMDDDYLEKRRIFMLKRPDHVLDGLSQAGHCLYNGFSNGITGVVTQPYQETQKNGFKGFVKGTLKGLSGLVVKPIAGVLDASAKAAEGVVSTATHFDDKPNDTRIRYPRIFYEKSKYFQKYIALDAQVVNFLIGFMNGKYKDIEIVTCFYLKETETQLNNMQRQILSATKSIHECFKNTSKILILSYQYILVLENMTLVQEIMTKEIVEILQPNYGFLRLSTEFKPNIEINILLDEIELKKATSLLDYLHQQVKSQYD
ncbi:unnamed protein product [Paramecium pentaurelia]|uniref:PH domain-containing protein n=1 Tax=Paramecium pentaurelia TaxID=43138 RepID=A0A8S1UU65_9CILI|nr:unnamed protein product [Paramecium pentaurelia]